MSKLGEIIRECILNGIAVRLSLEPDSIDGMAYMVDGFAKSGEAKVFCTKNLDIDVHLRYDTKETVENFEDLARICFSWCESYKDRGYGYGGWAPVFKQLGWITKKTTTTTYWETAK